MDGFNPCPTLGLRSSEKDVVLPEENARQRKSAFKR